MASGAEERRTSMTQVRFQMGDEEPHEHESGIDEPSFIRPRKHRHRMPHVLSPQPEPIFDGNRFDCMQLDDDVLSN